MRTFILLLVVSTSVFSWAAPETNSVCENNWKNVAPKLEKLRPHALCDSSMTSQECSEFLGLNKSAVVGAAAVAGGAAATRIDSQHPHFCQISASPRFLFLQIAQAAGGCGDPKAVHAQEVKGILKDSQTIREYELGRDMTEKLAKERPDLVALADKYDRYAILPPDEQKALEKEFAARGLHFRSGYGGKILEDTSTGEKGAARLIFSLSLRNHPRDQASKLRVNYDRLKDYFQNDLDFSERIQKVKETDSLLGRIDKGLYIKDPDSLAKLYEEAGGVLHPAQKDRLASAAEKAVLSFSQLEGRLKKTSASLLASYEKYAGGKAFALLKKTGGFFIQALLTVASGAAMAYDCTAGTEKECQKSQLSTLESVIPETASTGCAEIYSQYSTLVDGSCKESDEMTPKMRDFLMLPPDQQKQEICAHGNFVRSIDAVYAKELPPMTKSCDGNSVKLRSSDRDNALYTVIKFGENQTLENVQFSGTNGGYNFYYNPEGQMTNASLGLRTRNNYKIDPTGELPAAVRTANEDFQKYLVTALQTQGCCQGSLDSSSPYCDGVTGLANSSSTKQGPTEGSPRVNPK